MPNQKGSPPIMATPRKTSTSKTTQAAKTAGAKVPQDRQSASQDVEPELVDIEFQGATYQIDTDVIDDLDFMAALNASPLNALFELLGKDQFNAFVDHLKDLSEERTGKRKARMTDAKTFLEDVMRLAPFSA